MWRRFLRLTAVSSIRHLAARCDIIIATPPRCKSSSPLKLLSLLSLLLIFRFLSTCMRWCQEYLTYRIPLKPRKSFFFRATSQLLKLRFNGHIFISLVFPQFTSFHSVFYSFHSINWPMSSVWVFIAQMVAEATGSNPVEDPKIFFWGATSQLLKLRFNCDDHRFISYLTCIVPSLSLLERQLSRSQT